MRRANQRSNIVMAMRVSASVRPPLAALKTPRVGKRSDGHRIEASVAHKRSCDLHGLWIVTGNRYRKFWIRPVGLARKHYVGHGVECADDANAREILLRRYTDSVLFDFVGNGAITRRHRVTGVEHYFPLHLRGIVFADLWDRSVRDCNEEYVAERYGFLHRSRLGKAAKLGNHVLQLFRMARRKKYRMAFLDPQAAYRSTDLA